VTEIPTGTTTHGAPPSADDGRARTWLVVLSALAAALVVAVAVLSFVALSHRRDRQALEDARENALAAGRQAILNLDALSAATIDKDLARVVAGATGTFKEQFTKAQADLKELVVSRKTESSGQILSAGVVRSDTDTATVLVAVDRTVKDSTDKDGTVAHDRWRLDLEKHGGRWLVADLQPVA
jgi:Mce-associated membrane protein